MSLARVDVLAGLIRIYAREIDPAIPIQHERSHYHKTYAFTADERGEVRIQAALIGPTMHEIADISAELTRKLGYEFARWSHDGKEHIFTPRDNRRKTA